MHRLAFACLVIALAALGVGPLAAQEPPEGQRPKLPISGDRIQDLGEASYALGFSLGKSFHDSGVELAAAELLAGLEEGLAGEAGRLSEDEVVVLSQQLRNRMVRAQRERLQAEAAKNRAVGEAFLAENRTRPGVVTTASGLQYEVIEEGDGPSPTVDDPVRLHFRGTLLDGTVFDSSYDRGEPIVVRPNRVIPAWTETLPKMSVGSKWKLFVSPELGFGELGGGSNIPAGALLVYEIELLGIEDGDPEES